MGTELLLDVNLLLTGKKKQTIKNASALQEEKFYKLLRLHAVARISRGHLCHDIDQFQTRLAFNEL